MHVLNVQKIIYITKSFIIFENILSEHYAHNVLDRSLYIVFTAGKKIIIITLKYAGRVTFPGECTSDSDCRENEECMFDERTEGYNCRCIRDFVKDSNGACVQRKSKR